MRILITFARKYPSESMITLLALLLAGFMEGLSLSTLLPLLSIAIEGESQSFPSSGGSNSDHGLGPGEWVMNTLAGLGMTPTVGVLLVILVSGIVLKSGLRLLANKQVGYTVAHIATDLRLALLRALLFSRWQYYLSQPIGSFANAIATEANRASRAYYQGVNVVVLIIQVIVYFIVACLVSWEFTVICLVASAGLLLLLNRLVHMAKNAGRRQTKLLKSLLSRLTDTLQSVKPLKTMARENLIGPLLEGETIRLNRALRREVFSTEALGAAQEVFLTTIVAIGLYAALTYWELPFANVLVLVLLLARMIGRLGKGQKGYQKMMIAESAFWSIQNAIKNAEEEREPTYGGISPQLNSSIQLHCVSFAYRDRPILQEASLTIPVGQFTAIVGPSGAGKTTIADLITGLLQPQKGNIQIDDVPLNKLNLQQWRRMIGYVPQETLLLNDSVFMNVTLGEPELTERDVQDALQAAGAWEFVLAMPKGIQSSVGERGASLSGGQRQRIAIARALVHRPTLLIMDEATSALDPKSSAAICSTLQALRGALTILAISHLPSLVDAADRVYRLQNGIITLIADRSAVMGRSD